MKLVNSISNRIIVLKKSHAILIFENLITIRVSLTLTRG